MMRNFTVENYRTLICDINRKIEARKELLNECRNETNLLLSFEEKASRIAKIENEIRGMELLKELYMDEYLKLELSEEEAV